MPKVVLHDNESPEQLMRRFRKVVARSNVLTEVRRRRWHVSKSEVRRIERKKAERRARRRQSSSGRHRSGRSGRSGRPGRR